MKKFLRKWKERRQFKRDYHAWQIVAQSNYSISDFVRAVEAEKKG